MRCTSTPPRAAISRSTRRCRGRIPRRLFALLDATVTPDGLAATCAAGSTARSPTSRSCAAATRRSRLLVDARRFEGLREPLRAIGDVERILSRVALRSARPRDLTSLARVARARCRRCAPRCKRIEAPLIVELTNSVSEHADVVDLLQRAIAEEPSVVLRDGDVIAPGYDAELDELRQIATHTDEFLLELERRERERSGIPSLKLAYNRVSGFFIEVSRSQADRVPKDYIRRQTVKNAERFITPELKSFEDKVLGAREKSLAREREIYEIVLTQLTDRLAALQATANALASLDWLRALAERAAHLGWTEPQLVAETRLEIRGGRHPVVEHFIDGAFVPNDLVLDASRRMLIVTGPNMGGKIHVHAPGRADRAARARRQLRARGARRARPDRSHLHAHRRGRRSRRRALHVHGGDDRGREHPQQRDRQEPHPHGRDRPRHEHVRRPVAGLGRGAPHRARQSQLHACSRLTTSSSPASRNEIDGCANVHLDATEHRDGIVFLHAVKEGPASRSYGLAVAQLAGVPREVIAAAREYLVALEKGGSAHGDVPPTIRARADAPRRRTTPQAQLPLEPPAPPPVDPRLLELEAALKAVSADDLTPRAALDLVYKLRSLLG